jgi:hypothetical protein
MRSSEPKEGRGLPEVTQADAKGKAQTLRKNPSKGGTKTSSQPLRATKGSKRSSRQLSVFQGQDLPEHQQRGSLCGRHLLAVQGWGCE